MELALSLITIKKGLDLPMIGEPIESIEDARSPRSVGVVGPDFLGMKPTMEVSVGDEVKKGQLLFSDKKTKGVLFTSPSSGVVSGINRGDKRSLQSVSIDVNDGGEEIFASFEMSQLAKLDESSVRKQLLESGQWVALRTRPYSKVPAADTKPNSIFVNLMSTDPLSLKPQVLIENRQEEFDAGLFVLSRLTDGNIHVCAEKSSDLRLPEDEKILGHEFSGPHPAGLPGTHIHFLDPVGLNKSVWYIHAQEVVAFGHLFLTGKILSERVVALAGPGVTNPRLLRTNLGASLTELVAGELEEGDQRVISGSVLSGRTSTSPIDYLGRYHHQISVISQNRSRDLFGYMSPGSKKHSVFPVVLSKWLGEKKLEFSTSTNGSPRAMVPIGTYDAVMPLDILATQLLRSLLVGDIESAINLGCLDLDEEDLALCTYACPGKYEFGPVLRDMLTQIEREG